MTKLDAAGKLLGWLAGCFLAGVLVYFFALGGLERWMIISALRDYDMVARHGTLADRCVATSMVSYAYRNARDEDGYADWNHRAFIACNQVY